MIQDPSRAKEIIREELNAITNQEQVTYKIPQTLEFHGFQDSLSLMIDCNDVESVLPLSLSVLLSMMEALTEDTG